MAFTPQRTISTLETVGPYVVGGIVNVYAPGAGEVVRGALQTGIALSKGKGTKGDTSARYVKYISPEKMKVNAAFALALQRKKEEEAKKKEEKKQQAAAPETEPNKPARIPVPFLLLGGALVLLLIR